MLSYFQKFNSLPKEIKDAVASPEAAALIAELGQKYQLDLATLVMKVMAKEIALADLGAYLINQLKLEVEPAKELEKELRKKVFSLVIDYLLGPAAGPKLVFSEVDEKEVKANAQPIVTVDFDTAVEDALKRVVEKTHLNFADPLLSGKFKQVIKTYLRATRDRVGTYDMLVKAAELGGVALSRDAAERAVALATTELQTLQKISAQPQPKINVPEDRPQMTQTNQGATSPFKRITADEYNLEASLKDAGRLQKPADLPAKSALLAETAEPIKKIKPILDPAYELEPPLPTIVKQPPPATPTKKIIKEVLDGKPLDKPTLRQVASAAKPIINVKTSPGGKIRMDDIRFTPQVLSPVDELRYMNVRNFRRLNPDPLKATEKIKEKLELLSKDDYAKKIAGIVAWSESALNRQYLTLCRRALEENKPITDVLKEEQKQDPESLKPEELSAIIALNRQLKF